MYALPGMFNHRAQVGVFFANCVLMGGKVENIKDCTYSILFVCPSVKWPHTHRFFFPSKLQEGRRHVVVGVAMASHFLNTTGPCYAVHVH